MWSKVQLLILMMSKVNMTNGLFVRKFDQHRIIKLHMNNTVS